MAKKLFALFRTFSVSPALVFVAGCALASPYTALAEGDSTPDIMVVDMQQVVNESIIGKGAKNSLAAEVKKEEVKLKQLEDEMKKLKDDFARQGALLSGAALEEKKEALARKQRDYQLAYQDQSAMFSRRNRAEVGKIIEQIDKMVKVIGKEEKARFVLEKDPSYVLYSSERIDLTSKVVERLDATVTR